MTPPKVVECATCGAEAERVTWGATPCACYRCGNCHAGGHVAPDGTRQGGVFNVLRNEPTRDLDVDPDPEGQLVDDRLVATDGGTEPPRYGPLGDVNAAWKVEFTSDHFGNGGRIAWFALGDSIEPHIWDSDTVETITIVTWDDPAPDQPLLADGGQFEPTPLQEFAARLSGELCLDVTAVNGAGHAKLHATPACLKDNRDRLEEDGYNTELYLDELDNGDVYEHPTLLIHPRPGDLATDGGEDVVDDVEVIATTEATVAPGFGPKCQEETCTEDAAQEVEVRVKYGDSSVTDTLTLCEDHALGDPDVATDGGQETVEGYTPRATVREQIRAVLGGDER